MVFATIRYGGTICLHGERVLIVGARPNPLANRMNLTHNDIADLIRLIDASTLDEFVLDVGGV